MSKRLKKSFRVTKYEDGYLPTDYLKRKVKGTKKKKEERKKTKQEQREEKDEHFDTEAPKDSGSSADLNIKNALWMYNFPLRNFNLNEDPF